MSLERGALHERLLAEIVAEFPGFAIVPKRDSPLQQAHRRACSRWSPSADSATT